jgi:DNA polymerase-1
VYSTFCEWREKQVDEFGLTGRITTVAGWPLHRSPNTKLNTIINFPGQANAAEMLRLAVIETRHRGVEICAPVHDAILIQAPIGEIDEAIRETRAAMGAASRLILKGYELRVDCECVTKYPRRFFSADGLDFWNRIKLYL